jgi:hypothetical protein
LWYRCVLQCILLEKFNQKFTEGNTTSEDSNENSKSIKTKDSIATTSANSILKVNVGRKLVKQTRENTQPLFTDYVRKALQKLSLDNDTVGLL